MSARLKKQERLTKQERREAELRRLTILAAAKTLELRLQDRGRVRDALMLVGGVELPRWAHETAWTEKVWTDLIRHVRELAGDPPTTTTTNRNQEPDHVL